MGGDVVDDLDDVVGLGDIERPCLRRAAGCGDRAGDGLRGLGVEILNRNIGALGAK